jgi:hypothetical protein
MWFVAPCLPYPLAQLLAWRRLQNELGQKKVPHPSVAVQEPWEELEMEMEHQGTPAGSIPRVMSKLGAIEKQSSLHGQTPERMWPSLVHAQAST